MNALINFNKWGVILKNWKNVLIVVHQIENSKLTSPAEPPILMRCITFHIEGLEAETTMSNLAKNEIMY